MFVSLKIATLHSLQNYIATTLQVTTKCLFASVLIYIDLWNKGWNASVLVGWLLSQLNQNFCQYSTRAKIINQWTQLVLQECAPDIGSNENDDSIFVCLSSIPSFQQEEERLRFFNENMIGLGSSLFSALLMSIWFVMTSFLQGIPAEVKILSDSMVSCADD